MAQKQELPGTIDDFVATIHLCSLGEFQRSGDVEFVEKGPDVNFLGEVLSYPFFYGLLGTPAKTNMRAPLEIPKFPFETIIFWIRGSL